MKITPKRISNLKEMLMTFFWGNDRVLKEKLEREVEADTIVIATTEHFLNLVRSANGTYFYCITPKGKEYMNSK